MSSKRHVRRKMHEGKKGYESLEHAHGDAYQLHVLSGDTFDVYRCHVCGLYHVGHIRHQKKIAIARSPEGKPW